jgi:hypothetical protein
MEIFSRGGVPEVHACVPWDLPGNQEKHGPLQGLHAGLRYAT